MRAYNNQIKQFLQYLLNFLSVSSRLGLVVHHHKPKHPVKKKKKMDCCVQDKVTTKD